MERGRFVVVEGIDGSGSTTQAKYLCEYLKTKGRECYLTAEPSTGPIGETIRKFLREKEEKLQLLSHILALSFSADRLYHYEYEILPRLEKNIDVISDRYVLSSLVYQGLDLPQGWVKEINRYAPNPNLTILIDAPEEIASERRLKRSSEPEIFDKSDLQIQLRNRYLQLAFTAQAIVIDGSSDVQVVSDRMIEAVKQVLDLYA
jgi:dTMP kinase